MSYTTLRQAPYAISENKPFTGNSLTATFAHGKRCVCEQSDRYYTIYSYATVMYAECTMCGRWWYNRKKYSVTTSRHQTAIRMGKDIS